MTEIRFRVVGILLLPWLGYFINAALTDHILWEGVAIIALAEIIAVIGVLVVNRRRRARDIFADARIELDALDREWGPNPRRGDSPGEG